jgi:4-hydroxy-tetrahydrodipicolinate synthase
MAVENATSRSVPRGAPSATDLAASAHRSSAWNTSVAESTMACPAGVSTTPRPAGASTGTPTCRSSRLSCCDTAEEVNPSSSAARASVPRAATDRSARRAPTSIMKSGYAVSARKRRWTVCVGIGRIGPMTADFGTNLVAMVTPMHPDGTISEPGVAALVDHLLATGCDGIVVGGTTGEAPTLTDAEAGLLVRAVARHAKGRARVIAGVGTYDTAASVRRARDAEAEGADALLLVCPYYSRPTQAGVVAHCVAVADATRLPVMLYDVPARAGIAMAQATLVELAAHPRIRAVKDAKGDLFEAMTVMSSTSLAYYCGIDELNLPYLACGATGVLSVVGNVVADRNAELIRAIRMGDLDTANAVHRSLLPMVAAVMRTSPGAVMAKVALVELGIIPHATVRLPLLEPPQAHREQLRAALGVIAVPA